MVPRGEHHYQYVQGKRKKEQRSIDDSHQENAEAPKRRKEDYDVSDDRFQKGPCVMISR